MGLHDEGGRKILRQQLAHALHINLGVLEKLLVALTEAVESFLALARYGKAVLGTLSVTKKQITTMKAYSGKTFKFVGTETEVALVAP